MNAARISVIMAAYLGEYESAATGRVEKFKRAVTSFLDQGFPGAELIIVSDGCELTRDICNWEILPRVAEENWAEKGIQVHLVEIKKQPLFSGGVRNAGLNAATGAIVCYLDTDDVFLPGHLQAISDGFVHNPEKPWEYKPWVYFDDYIAAPDLTVFRQRSTNLSFGGIGTGGFAHEKGLGVEWPDGYGHDYGVVTWLMTHYPNTRKIFGPRYLVCHLGPSIDY
jgi:glycosyltransferase involved in cell wall biosynthesis